MGILFSFEPFEVDEQATLEQVRKFFSREVPKLRRMASTRKIVNGMLSAPRLNVTGVRSQGHQNHNENILIDASNAKQELDTINQCIDQCKEGRLIKIRYYQGLNGWQSAIESGFGYSQFYKLLREALFEFATLYAQHGRDLRITKEDAQLEAIR